MPASTNKLYMTKISETGDITAARDAIMEAADSLSLLGSLGHITTMEERDQLVQAAITFYVKGKTKEALQQLVCILCSYVFVFAICVLPQFICND